MYTTYQPREFQINSRRPGDTIPYLTSGDPESAKNKPTVILLPGVFQEAREMAIDLATIAHVFDAHVVVVDYASLAAENSGMRDGICYGLAKLIKATESPENTTPPKRILIGESLGGFVAQAIAFASEDDSVLKEQLNLQHLILSHTIPPQLLDKRVERFVNFLEMFGERIPMPVARFAINRLIGWGRRKVDFEDNTTLLDAEWVAVQDIMTKERFLTGRRGYGYVRSAAESIAESRQAKKPTTIPTDVIYSSSDKVFKSIPDDIWQQYHTNVTVTALNGSQGHYFSELKESYFINQFIPTLARILDNNS